MREALASLGTAAAWAGLAEGERRPHDPPVWASHPHLAEELRNGESAFFSACAELRSLLRGSGGDAAASAELEGWESAFRSLRLPKGF